MPTPLSLVVLCFVLAGCVSSSSIPLGDRTYPARPPTAHVTIYDSEADVPGPWEKVARVIGDGSDSADWAAIVDAMAADARRAGADALVLTSLGERHAADHEESATRRIEALAIRFLERAARSNVSR